MRLAWTCWGIPSSFFEIWVQYRPRACQPKSLLHPNFLEFRWYSPMRPRQMHSIPSFFFYFQYNRTAEEYVKNYAAEIDLSKATHIPEAPRIKRQGIMNSYQKTYESERGVI